MKSPTYQLNENDELDENTFMIVQKITCVRTTYNLRCSKVFHANDRSEVIPLAVSIPSVIFLPKLEMKSGENNFPTNLVMIVDGATLC